MRELSLFTGAGGGLLGAMLLGWRTVAAVERDPYCVRLLCERGGYVADAKQGDSGRRSDEQERDAQGRVASDGYGAFPIHTDIRTFDGTAWRGRCDIVSGGFPCQPFSQAGARRGADDPRNMWPHAVRVLRESGAPLGFFENVPGLLSSGYFGTVLGDLAEAGFDAEWCVLGADDVGAPHRRKRLWILAYRSGAGSAHVCEVQAGRELAGRDTTDGCGDGMGLSPWWCDPADVGDADAAGPQGHGRLRERAGELSAGEDGAAEYDDWLLEPYVGRVAHGIPSRVDRLRGLGNAQVPQSMAAAFITLARQAGL